MKDLVKPKFEETIRVAHLDLLFIFPSPLPTKAM
jgi:hypothetical protein